MQGVRRLIRIKRSWHSVWMVLLGSVLILSYILSKVVRIRSRELNRRSSDQIKNIRLWYCFWEVSIWTLNRVHWDNLRLYEVGYSFEVCEKEKEPTK